MTAVGLCTCSMIAFCGVGYDTTTRPQLYGFCKIDDANSKQAGLGDNIYV